MSASSAEENNRLREQGRRARSVRRKKCIVVGIGNPLMGDDGFGIEVAKALRKLNLGRRVTVLERQTVDISVLDSAKGASKLVIVDAVKSGRRPGSVMKFNAGVRRSLVLRVPLSHEQNLYDILDLARKSGMRLPPTVVVGVEPADCTAGNGLSVEVKEALPRVLGEVKDEVKECAERGTDSPARPF
jgi:hydrogenase maturation protease